ncbi:MULTISPECIES: hypothetical protein [Erwinia]|uniref:Uncharacterized protein n=1 Tax=Erwinia rhapontici TaxID=55212 RepID=A0ABN6DIL4_ERWRD|nr:MULTISPECIES: hypothetical protein [Erwinia]NNS06118.1 hypothetical protein [Erwinia sp. JH02]BCQ34658.1 hypothetical protein ERHA53_20010 [Erwinia rhapontici]BCQ39532.1 hypothetical protein ERHA54_21350 [Erwinia rhapontici]BCQ44698.1 hypothetical protein ERHA55_22250 [Erwinia rhapontici]
MPVEIKQLVIKSKTINDDTKKASFDSERSNYDAEEDLPEKKLPYHFMTSPDTTRER